MMSSSGFTKPRGSVVKQDSVISSMVNPVVLVAVEIRNVAGARYVVAVANINVVVVVS